SMPRIAVGMAPGHGRWPPSTSRNGSDPSSELANVPSVGSNASPRHWLSRFTVRRPPLGSDRHSRDEREETARGAAEVSLLAIDRIHRHGSAEGRHINHLEGTKSEFFLDAALRQ